MKQLTFSLLFLSLSTAVFAQDIKSARVVFYNTENLFDTIDDPKTLDEEFTPNGKSHWTAERYQTKLTHIARVIAAILDKDAPLVIGLAEVENKKVAEQLAAQPILKKYALGVIEQDSPDPRGIDVALLYNKKILTITGTEFLTVKLPDLDRGTRDIIYVRGMVKGAEMHFFVNHWPSRRDGAAKSQPRRFAAAEVLHAKVDAILSHDSNANIIIIGDLNDNPVDSSVAIKLGAKDPSDTTNRIGLYDLMLRPYISHKFTTKYKGRNDVFDQMIVSGHLLDKTSILRIKSSEGNIYNAKWILYHHPKYGDIPNRTYSGPIYYGGYSDHLPVYIDVWLSCN